MSIPYNLLVHSASLTVPSDRDLDGNNTVTTYSLTKIAVQPVAYTKRAADNTMVTFAGVVFYDARRSLPALDIAALKRTADTHGGRMQLTHASNVYTVGGVDIVYAPDGGVHHYEMLLV